MLTSRPWIRIAPLAIALVAAAPLQACFGKFALTRKIYEFNKEVSDSWIVQEVVFLAFIIVPVYEVVAVLDLLILNLIEVITGDNPVAMGELGESREIALADGSHLTLTWTVLGVQIEKEVDGKVERFLLKNEEDGLKLLDDSGELLGATRRLDDGTFQVIDGEGHVLIHPGKAMLADMSDALLTGGSRGLALHAERALRSQESLAYAQ